MGGGIVAMRYLDWLGRVRVTWNLMLGVGLVLLGLAVGAVGGRYTSDDQPWPYTVLAREIAETEIPPGGEITMRRKIEYTETDCWRRYERRAVSEVQGGEQPGRVVRFASVVEDSLPFDLSGRWQTWRESLPEDMPCGPAYLVETVTAACTWWQRNVRLLRKPDITTHFSVVCPAPG